MADLGAYCCTDFIGGGTGALDKLDGSVLNDKDRASVITLTSFAPYSLDADSGAGESSPQIIAPNTNPGNKRWILTGGIFKDLTIYGKAGIGTIAPLCTNGGLDIASGGLSLIIGADSAASTRTDETDKIGRMSCPHYTNAEEPFGIMTILAKETINELRIGGGSASQNAATEIDFYTTANNTTPTGTVRGTFNSAGDFNLTGSLKVDNVQVVSNQGAAVADATDNPTAILRLNELLARCRVHGLIAT